jgi:hypothetical protein
MRGAGLDKGARCLYGSRSRVTERRTSRLSRLRWNDVAREVAGLRALSDIGFASRAAAPSCRRGEQRSKAGAVVPPGEGVCGWVCCSPDDNGVVWRGGESGLLDLDYGAADQRVSAVGMTVGGFMRLAGSGSARAASSEEPGPLRADCVSAAWVVNCGQADHYAISVRLAGVVARHSRFVACPYWLSRMVGLDGQPSGSVRCHCICRLIPCNSGALFDKDATRQCRRHTREIVAGCDGDG